MQDIQKYPTVTSLQIQQADPGLEKEKNSIYSHPLYPLLSLLLEQCDQATSSPDSQSSDTFEADLQSYIQRHEGHDRIFFTENRDLDSLIVKAIHVLRIHLNELRKVNELCRDFCTRYINCLKTKIHQNSMFDDSDDSSPNGSERLSPIVMPGSAYNSPYNVNGRTYLEMGPNHRHMGGHLHNMGDPCNSTMNGITVDCGDYTNGANSSPNHTRDDITNNNYLPSVSSAHSGVYNNLLDPSKQKRGVLPKKATQIMKQWLFQHLVHPYPTEDEKRQIANQTNLTLLQVNNWFINARRRILQPMLETNGSPGKEKSVNTKLDKSDSVSEPEDAGSGLMYASSCASRKKKAATNRPSNNRFWPASLATAVNVFSAPCATSSPNSTAISDRITPKLISQIDTSEEPPPRKKVKTNPSDMDIYQPPKVFSSKGSYEPYIGEVDYKSQLKVAKSHIDRSTPQYTELSSPNNLKSNSLDERDRTRSDPNCLSASFHVTANSPPKSIPDGKKSTRPDISSSNDTTPDGLFPPSIYNPYMAYNPYNNLVVPQSSSYLNNTSMFYNAERLQRAVQQNESNPMSSSLFHMRHPNCPTSSPIYDSIYPNYEQLVDKGSATVASHINDLFGTAHNGFSHPWDDQKSVKTLAQYAAVDNATNRLLKNDFMNSLPESWPLTNHSYPHLDTFPNFKGFHSKTNTN